MEDLLPFQFESMCANPQILMNNVTQSLQHLIVQQILKKEDQQFLENSIVICSSNKDLFKSMYPKIKIEEKYTTELIKEFLVNKNRGAMIFYNCTVDQKNETLIDLLFNGRHYKKIVIFISNNSLTSQLRSNFDYIFMNHNNYEPTVQRMYNHFGNLFSNVDHFNQVLDKETKQGNTVVYTNRGYNKSDFNKRDFNKKDFNEKIIRVFNEQIRVFKPDNGSLYNLYSWFMSFIY